MPNLTPEGLRVVSEIASRHGFSREAALSLIESLSYGNGFQAQFNHPELGGMGQWSQGGMIMIGDMFNQNLKYRVEGLCNDLASLSREQPSIHAPAPSFQSQSQGDGFSLFSGGSSGSWWPAELGQPASSGAQNDMRYAFFPGTRRLAIQQGSDKVQVYDTGDQQLSGFSQAQGSGQSLTFNSQFGLVRLADLPRVYGEADAPASAPPSPSQPPLAFAPPPDPIPAPARSSASSGPALGIDEILKTIETLAALRQKNILTEEEFAAKKAELLSRI